MNRVNTFSQRTRRNSPYRHRLTLLAAVLLLGGCGGGSSSSTPNSGSSPSASINSGANSALKRTVSIAWAAPSTRVDNTPVVPSEIGGYRIYYGNDSSQLQLLTEISDPNRTDFTTPELAPGTYYFAITAYDTYGTESQYSAIGNKVIL